MRYIIFIVLMLIGIAYSLCRIVCREVPLGVSVTNVEEMVSRDPEILLTGEFAPSNNCTYVYTISKQRFEKLCSSNVGFELGCAKVDVNRIVDNCRNYAAEKNNNANQANVLKLLSLELFVRAVGTNDVWYARASFANRYCDWQTAVRMGYGGIVVYSLIDGEVLKPRSTEYTRFIDQERKRLKTSPRQ